jgi:hypothetical protein
VTALIQQWHQMMREIANGSACHRFHSARQRLARWLLAATDRVQSSHMELTQEQLANALGLQRTGVTVRAPPSRMRGGSLRATAASESSIGLGSGRRRASAMRGRRATGTGSPDTAGVRVNVRQPRYRT